MLLQEKAKARKQSGTFLIEGKREIEIALKGGYEMETILFLPEIISEKESQISDPTLKPEKPSRAPTIAS